MNGQRDRQALRDQICEGAWTRTEEGWEVQTQDGQIYHLADPGCRVGGLPPADATCSRRPAPGRQEAARRWLEGDSTARAVLLPEEE